MPEASTFSSLSNWFVALHLLFQATNYISNALTIVSHLLQEMLQGTGNRINGDGREVDAGGKKRTVEKTYQKKTQLEHILLRPDTYIGKGLTYFWLLILCANQPYCYLYSIRGSYPWSCSELHFR